MSILPTELSLLLNSLSQNIANLSGYSIVRAFIQDSNGNTNFQGNNSATSITSGSIYAVGASSAAQTGIGAAQQIRAEVFNAFSNSNILWSDVRFSGSDKAPTAYLAGGIGNNISVSGCAATPELILRLAISSK